MQAIWKDYKLRLLCKSGAVFSAEGLRAILSELVFFGSEGLSVYIVCQFVGTWLGNRSTCK